MPHSDIHGSKPARGSPWLFAACHVLHRLLVPRHPPNALIVLEIHPRLTDPLRLDPGINPPCTGTIQPLSPSRRRDGGPDQNPNAPTRRGPRRRQPNARTRCGHRQEGPRQRQARISRPGDRLEERQPWNGRKIQNHSAHTETPRGISKTSLNACAHAAGPALADPTGQTSRHARAQRRTRTSIHPDKRTIFRKPRKHPDRNATQGETAETLLLCDVSNSCQPSVPSSPDSKLSI